jgi:hypothetical protein
VPATAGTYGFTVTVTDSSNPPLTSTSAQINVTISDSAIVIASASPPAGTVTYTYPGFGFSASGGSPPYTWKASGTPPPGLAVGSDGTVSGTPTQAGTFAFSVTATDSAQQPMSSPPLATHIMIGNPVPLTFSPTPAPPAGVVGTPYGPFAFSASGGFQPLKWSIKGSLPPGLTLGKSDGSLSGTPTTPAASPYSFTVTVTDSAVPQAASQSLPFIITVTLPPPPVINDQESPTATVGSAYRYQFTASNGVAPLTWSETTQNLSPPPPPLSASGLTLGTQGLLSGTPTDAGQFPITLGVVDAARQPGTAPFPTTVRVSLARPPATFTTTGSMKIPRSGHAATLLLSGKVLVTGGGNGAADPTAELYDPASGTFSSTTGNMIDRRIGHTATLLKLSDPGAANYGKVLILGSGDSSAELYTPTTSTFAATGSLNHARTSPTATLLNTGKVLIVGGSTTANDTTAELYDPASGTFSFTTGDTTAVRSGHSATLLLDGHVLIAGGTDTATAELYDPTTGTFTPTTGNMTQPRAGHTATRLGTADGPQNGYILIVGTNASSDLYDPGSKSFTAVGSLAYDTLRPISCAHTASLRDDGTVLVAGGSSAVFGICTRPLNSRAGAGLFAPESDGFTVTGSLNTARDTHTATVLANGDVLVAGGTRHMMFCRSFPIPQCFSSAKAQSSAELFK